MSESPTIVQAPAAPLVSELEIAAGQLFGEEPLDPLPPAAAEPRAAIESALAAALARPPCLVAFSGGRDSSALLAVAARVARREGLEPPIAITHRFRDAPDTDETDWQNLVLRHVGVSDWQTLEHGPELDLVGPVAQRTLARHGPLYPPNVHAFVPLLEQARGGTLVTGFDGDLYLGGWFWTRLAAVRARRRRPQPRDVLRGLYAYAPVPVRRSVARRRNPGPEIPWLTEPARREMADLRARHYLPHPNRFDEFVHWAARRRMLVVQHRHLDRLAAAAGAAMVHPFADRAFLASYAAAGGRDGFGDRTEAMRVLFGDVLPEAALARRGKARFDTAYFNDHSRALASAWDGTGFDPGLVRADVLRREWQRPVASFRTAMLLQSLWLQRASRLAP